MVLWFLAEYKERRQFFYKRFLGTQLFSFLIFLKKLLLDLIRVALGDEHVSQDTTFHLLKKKIHFLNRFFRSWNYSQRN